MSFGVFFPDVYSDQNPDTLLISSFRGDGDGDGDGDGEVRVESAMGVRDDDGSWRW